MDKTQLIWRSDIIVWERGEKMVDISIFFRRICVTVIDCFVVNFRTDARN